MNNLVEDLWLSVHSALKTFSDRLVVATDPGLIRDLGRTANDAFLLRGYLALRRHKDGDEIAITVDLHNDGQQLTLESDVCTNDGELIATGPTTVIPLVRGQVSVEAGIRDWLNKFDQFLQENERAVVLAVTELT